MGQSLKKSGEALRCALSQAAVTRNAVKVGPETEPTEPNRRAGGYRLGAAAASLRHYHGSLAAAGIFVALVATFPSPARDAVSDQPRGAASAQPERIELTGKRSRMSRTYARADGSLEAQVFTEAIHFEDGAGALHRIDNSLVRSSRGGLENGANRYTVSFPDTLAQPVRLREGEATVSFSLEGAAPAPAAASGSRVTYPDAQPGVDLMYEARADSVKETLILSSPSAPNTYTFRLETSPGLSPQVQDGGIEFVDRSGRKQLEFTPPFMEDSAGGLSNAVSLGLAARGDHYVVRLKADQRWLTDAERTYPVMIDPSVVLTGSSQECTVRSGSSQNTSSCNGNSFRADAATTIESRALLKFAFGAIPRDAQVTGATLTAHVLDGNSRFIPISVHELTRSWSVGATWNRYDGVNPWASPGGDFRRPATATRPVGQTGTWVTWGVTPLVQRWVADPSINHGLILKREDGSTVLEQRWFSGTASVNKPYLSVTYQDPGPQLALSGDLYDRRTRLDDHRSEGLYGAQAPLHVTATDTGSGVRSIEILLDGQRQDYVEYPCPANQCRSREDRDFVLLNDQHPDGEHAVRVIAKDLGGNPTTADWTVTVDRRGDVYEARHYTHDPAAGGVLRAHEWARMGTQTARSEVPDYLMTRRPVPCDSSSPTGPQCDELRERSRLGEADAAEEDTYSVTKGTQEDDPNLPIIATILEPATLSSTDASGQGPIGDVVQPWQTLPPAHGSTYERHVATENEDHSQPADGTEAEADETRPLGITVEVWIDAATKMPLRSRVTAVSGEVDEVFFSYAIGRTSVADHPSNFFLLDPPSRRAQEQRTEYRTGISLGDQTDRETGQPFRAWDLGPTPALTAGSFCRATTMLNTLDEPGSDPITAPGADGEPDPFGPETVVDVEYVRPGPNGCEPLTAPPPEVSITVSSAAKNSSTAMAWRVGYKEAGTAIESDPQDPDRFTAGIGMPLFQSSPTPAYIVPLGDRLDDPTSGMLLETSVETITVAGPFNKSTIQEVADQLVMR